MDGYALPGLGDRHTLACNILTDLNSGRMKTDRSHFAVMAHRMMFGGVVAEVVCAFAPENFKMSLLDSIVDPIKSHVDGFRAALFEGFVGDSTSWELSTCSCYVVGYAAKNATGVLL